MKKKVKQKIKDLEFDVKRLTENNEVLYNAVNVLAEKSGIEFMYDLDGVIVGGVNCSDDLRAKDIKRLLRTQEQRDKVNEEDIEKVEQILKNVTEKNDAEVEIIITTPEITSDGYPIKIPHVNTAMNVANYLHVGICGKGTGGIKTEDIPEYQLVYPYKIGDKVFIMEEDSKVILEVFEKNENTEFVCNYVCYFSKRADCLGSLCHSFNSKDRNEIYFKKIPEEVKERRDLEEQDMTDEQWVENGKKNLENGLRILFSEWK